jgi:hypothetical protein
MALGISGAILAGLRQLHDGVHVVGDAIIRRREQVQESNEIGGMEVRRVASTGQALAFAGGGAEEGPSLSSSAIPAAVMYSLSHRQLMAHRNLPVVAAFLPEVQHAVFTEIAVVGQTEFGHGTNAGTGIGEHAEHGAITESHNMFSVDRFEQPAVLDGKLGGLCPRSHCI